jgi:hypothetical protein
MSKIEVNHFILGQNFYSDESSSNDEEEEEQEATLKDHASTIQIEEDTSSLSQPVGDVTQWRSQSEWLFLSANNKKIEKPGKYWKMFFEQISGQSLTIPIWRKIVETHSHKVNSREQQERLSEALLHQHRTGAEYYVSEDVHEVAEATMDVWNQVTTPVTPHQPFIPPSPSPITQVQYGSSSQFTPLTSPHSHSPSNMFTPTQPGYSYRPGDWDCNHCGNRNYGWRVVCHKCKILK